jgi:hypothetical protein
MKSIRLTPELMKALGDLANSGRLTQPDDTDNLSEGFEVTSDPSVRDVEETDAEESLSSSATWSRVSSFVRTARSGRRGTRGWYDHRRVVNFNYDNGDPSVNIPAGWEECYVTDGEETIFFRPEYGKEPVSEWLLGGRVRRDRGVRTT